MIDITPTDLAVRKAKVGQTYILPCTLKNATELVLDCNIQATQACSERWKITPNTLRLKPRQSQSVELKLIMKQITSAAARRSLASGGLKDLFYLKTQYFEQRFHVLVFGESETSSRRVTADLEEGQASRRPQRPSPEAVLSPVVDVEVGLHRLGQRIGDLEVREEALQLLVSQLEKLVKDKDEVIQVLQSHLQIDSKGRGGEVQVEDGAIRVHKREIEQPPGDESAPEMAAILGSNAQLRAKVTELSSLVEEKENELSISQEALKAISIGEPKVKALIHAAVSKERSVHESRNRKVLEMFAVKDSQFSQLKSKLEESNLINEEKSELISELKGQVQATEAKVIEVLGENQELQKENYSLKAENVSLSHLKPSNVHKSLEHQLAKSKEVNQKLSSKLKETQALEEFSNVKNESLSGSVHELEKSLASIVADNAEKMRKKDREIMLLTQRVEHSEKLLSIRNVKGSSATQHEPRSSQSAAGGFSDNMKMPQSGNLEVMLELKQEEISQLKSKLKKLENIHEKAKQTAIDSENKLNELLQKKKSGGMTQRSREEIKSLKMKLQSLSHDSKSKLEQKENLLKIERAKSNGLMEELMREKERSAKAATTFSGNDEREAMERKIEASTASLKECQDALQIIQAKYITSEKERRQIESLHRNHKAEMARKLLHSDQNVRRAELHSQQKVQNLESTIRTLSGRSIDHKELAEARAQVVSLGGELRNLQSDNLFLNEQIEVCEEKLTVAQGELQEHLSYGDLKEFRDVYGKYISDSAVIVELTKKLKEAEMELNEAREGIANKNDSQDGPNSRTDILPSNLGMHSKAIMTNIDDKNIEESIVTESKLTSLQTKLSELSLYTTQLAEQIISKEKELAAVKDDLLPVMARNESQLNECEERTSDEYVSLDKLTQAQNSKKDAEFRLRQLEEKLSFAEHEIAQKERDMKEEKARLSKKLEESRNAEMETRRQLTEKACSLEDKTVQLNIMKEALNALKLGYVSNPCDEDHILLIAKVASAEAKDLAHQKHVENLREELDLRFEIIHETRVQLIAINEGSEKLQIELEVEKKRCHISNEQLKKSKAELERFQSENTILESKLQHCTDKNSKLRMELDAEKLLVQNQRKRHTDLIAAERQSIVQEIEKFKVEHCDICESSRNIRRFIREYDDAIMALVVAVKEFQAGETEELYSCVSSMKYLGLEASRLFASNQTSLHIFLSKNEILGSKVKDLELKNDCLADKLTVSDAMNVLMTKHYDSRSKMTNLLINEGGQLSQERVQRLASDLEQAQLQIVTGHKKKVENSMKGKTLEQNYLQLQCEVKSLKTDKEATFALPEKLPEVSNVDYMSHIDDLQLTDSNVIAQTVSTIASHKLAESHLMQLVIQSNKRAEKAQLQLKELKRSFEDLSKQVSEYNPGQGNIPESQDDIRLELTLKTKENFELSQKLKRLSIEMKLQKEETQIAKRKVDMLEKNFRDTLKSTNTALTRQRSEQEGIVKSMIEEVHSEVSEIFNTISSLIKNSQESNKESKSILIEDFKQMKSTAKEHSIQALANLSYLDIEGIPVVKVSDLRDMKLQKQVLEQENEKLLKRLERKEKEVLELTEDVESQKLALRDLSNTFSKSAFKKMHSSGMLKSTISTLNKKLVESKLVQADMQRKLKISARAELELRQLLHSREQRLTALNTEVRAYNQALDSIQKFAAKEKNLEFKRILREVVLNLSTMKSNDSDTPNIEDTSHGNSKLDARMGIYSGLRIQIAEKNARISHLEERLSEYLASTPLRAHEPRDIEADKDMLREVSKFNKLLKEAVSDALSRIANEVEAKQKPDTLNGAIELVLDKMKHTELMLLRSQAKTKELRAKMKDTKTEDVNASLQNAVKGLSDKCRALVMEKAEIKLERDRLLERLNAMKVSVNKKGLDSKRTGSRKNVMKAPEVKSVTPSPPSQNSFKVEGGISAQFQQIHSFADMIDVHLSAIQDFIVKASYQTDQNQSTKIEEDFSSIESLVCIIKDTLKIVASEVSEKKDTSEVSKPLPNITPKLAGTKQKVSTESEWERKYSSLKEAYSTYRKSSKVEMNALKEKNLNASSQVIEAAKDKVSMQVELREMQRMVEKGIHDIETQQKSRSNLSLKLTEKEAQLRIAKSKARLSEDQAHSQIEDLRKELKSAANTITKEREERGKVLIILRKAVNDLKTQLHIEFDLRNQLYTLELEKENVVTSCKKKEDSLDAETKNHQNTERKLTELEESLIKEKQQSHQIKVKYEYMREGLKQLEIRFNAADKQRVMLEQCVEMKLREADRIADSISIVDFGKAPMMILLEVQEIEKLINKMTREIQKAEKAREVSSDRWKFTSTLMRYKKVVTDWKRFEEGKLKKKIAELKGGMNRIQNQNMDLVMCSEKAADTIVNLQNLISKLEREKKSMVVSLDNVKEMYSAEMSRLRIQTKKEAMLEQQHTISALSKEIEGMEKELKDFQVEISSLKRVVKVDAKMIIQEFHENAEASRNEVLSLMRSLERLIPGLKVKKAQEAAKPPKLVKKAKSLKTDFTSEAIQEIQDLEDHADNDNLELKLKLQCQLTRKSEKAVAKLRSEVQELKQELKREMKKHEGFPSRDAFTQQVRAFNECKKALKDSKSLCLTRLKEVKLLKEQLADLRRDSSEHKFKDAAEKVDSLQRKLRDAQLSIQRKDAIINDLRQSIKSIQEKDLSEKLTKTEAKNKQLAATVQRQSVSIRELRANATQASKSLEAIAANEKSEKTNASDLTKRLRNDVKRKDVVITQLNKHLGQLQEDLAKSLSTVEDAHKRESFGRKSAEHDWATFKTFMKNASSALQKMSKLVVQSSNEMRHVVQAVSKAEKFHSMDSSAKNIAQLVDMSAAEVEDIMQVDESQSETENLETYLMKVFNDINQEIESIHQANVKRGKDKFVAAWDPNVLLSIAEILEKEFIKVKVMLGSSMKVLPDVLLKLPPKKKKAAPKKKVERGSPSGSTRDLLVEELQLLAKRVKK